MVINQAPPPIPVRSSVVNAVSQRPAPSSPSRSPSAASERKKSTEKKPRHTALGKDFIARRKGAPLARSRAVSPVVAARLPTQVLRPVSSLHSERLHPVCSHLPQPTVQHALEATERTETHLKPAISLAFHTYRSSQGHHVRFQEADGNRTQALEEAAGNGFAHVFTIKEKEHKQWEVYLQSPLLV